MLSFIAVATVSAYEAFSAGVGIGVLSVGIARGASRLTYSMKK